MVFCPSFCMVFALNNSFIHLPAVRQKLEWLCSKSLMGITLIAEASPAKWSVQLTTDNWVQAIRNYFTQTET